MITTGTILGKNVDKNNTTIYQVEISIFKNAGIVSNLNNAIFDATCCAAPGSYEAYVTGDLVYISFVNNLYSQPIILGKIYKSSPTEVTESSSYQFINTLKVTNKAELPNNTLLGNISVNDLQSTLLRLSVLEGNLNSLEILKHIDNYDPEKEQRLVHHSMTGTDPNTVRFAWVDESSSE